MAVVPLVLRYQVPDPDYIYLSTTRMLLEEEREDGESGRLLDGVGGKLGHER